MPVLNDLKRAYYADMLGYTLEQASGMSLNDLEHAFFLNPTTATSADVEAVEDDLDAEIARATAAEETKVSSATLAANLTLGVNPGLKSTTSNGADNGTVTISGGGAIGSDRGAEINVYGNEVGGAPGRLQFAAGQVVSSIINFSVYDSGANYQDIMKLQDGAVRLYAGIKMLAPGGVGVGNSAAATTLGTVTKKMEVFDGSGVSLGFVAIYDAIT